MNHSLTHSVRTRIDSGGRREREREKIFLCYQQNTICFSHTRRWPLPHTYPPSPLPSPSLPSPSSLSTPHPLCSLSNCSQRYPLSVSLHIRGSLSAFVCALFPARSLALYLTTLTYLGYNSSFMNTRRRLNECWPWKEGAHVHMHVNITRWKLTPPFMSTFLGLLPN